MADPIAPVPPAAQHVAADAAALVLRHGARHRSSLLAALAGARLEQAAWRAVACERQGLLFITSRAAKAERIWLSISCSNLAGRSHGS